MDPVCKEQSNFSKYMGAAWHQISEKKINTRFIVPFLDWQGQRCCGDIAVHSWHHSPQEKAGSLLPVALGQHVEQLNVTWREPSSTWAVLLLETELFAAVKTLCFPAEEQWPSDCVSVPSAGHDVLCPHHSGYWVHPRQPEDHPQCLTHWQVRNVPIGATQPAFHPQKMTLSKC